jgi:putative hemolysin
MTQGMDTNLLMQIFLLILLVGVNAFFASSEIAIISLNDNKVRKMAEEGHKKAKLLDKLISEPSRFLATIQVGITLSGLLASAFAAESFADRLTNFVKSFGFPVDEGFIKLVTLVVITIVLAYFQLVLGELVPKRVAMQKPEDIAMFSIGPISVLSRITSPFVHFLTFSTNFIIRLFGGNPEAEENRITEEEIRMMVDVGQEKGVIQGAEKEMINNIFEFDDTTLSEIMTHRTDIVALECSASLEEATELLLNEKYTRVPVFEDDIDNIVGILHVKDLFNYLAKRPSGNFQLQEILRKPYFVPEYKKTDDLLKELKKKKNHMAIVIDEYGGTAGIVTMEDLLEEIVGSILDEHDEDIREIDKVDENTFIIEGTTDLDQVREILNADLPSDEYDTIGGFIISQLGRIPGEDERPEIEFNGFVFKVEEVVEKRITRIKVCRTQ